MRLFEFYLSLTVRRANTRQSTSIVDACLPMQRDGQVQAIEAKACKALGDMVVLFELAVMAREHANRNGL